MKRAIFFILFFLLGIMIFLFSSCDTSGGYAYSSMHDSIDSGLGTNDPEIVPNGTEIFEPKDIEIISMSMYHPNLDTGFSLSNQVDKTVFNSNAYTSLSIFSNDGDISVSNYGGVTAFGIVGSNIGLRFKINNSANVGEKINGSDEWMLGSDSWGEQTGQNVNGVPTGKIESGALVVQTSYDGVSWSDENKAKYSEGLYTTNYYVHYKTNETTIYYPSGEDISKGIFVRVLYAYEICKHVDCEHPKKALGFLWQTGWEHDYDVKYENYVEAYTFYLCYNSPNVVMFHNLSLGDQIEEKIKDEEALLIEIAKATETLTNGSVTVTGFSIDNKLNEAAIISIKKNNQPFEIPANKEIRENGRYDICVKTVLGEEVNTTIFVHSMAKEELYSLYFGESFLIGKRIFSKGVYPIYEGGLTSYNLLDLENIYPGVCVEITNKTTGTKTILEQSWLSRKELFVESGEYEAKVYTNATYGTENASGDNQTFVFYFSIIAEGTAPGPQINKESLQGFSVLTNPSNLYPTYYGVTFQSAHRGNITLAFSTKKAAIDYAYNYEKGMVEVQEDGSFRYKGSLIVSQKVKYNSVWDLTDAVYYFAEQAVQKLKIDLRDEFTYLTLSDDVLASVENLRTLELTKSIVVFANQTEKESLLLSGNIPVLNSKKYSYLLPGTTGEVVSGYSDFMFIKDKNGYDSNSVVVIDEDGNRFNIEYNVSVDEQLKNFGFKTGIITIEEKTIYGDFATYKAIYIAEGDNSAIVEIEGYDGKTKTTRLFDMNDNNSSITLNAFSIKNIVDEFDPYGIVIVSKEGVEDFYCFTENDSRLYTTTGTYIITLVNRLGYVYSFTVKIDKEVYYTMEISGEGINGSQYLMYADGDVVNLPQLTKYGYTFAGYKTPNGNIYLDEVQALFLKGSSVLETVWIAKQFNMTLQTDEGVFEKKIITFGETYTLPTLATTSNQRFIGWKNANNEFISSFTVEEEGDICLTACFEIIQNNAPMEESEGNDVHGLLRILYIVMAIIGGVLLIIGFVGGFIKGDWDTEAYPWICFGIGLVLLIVSILLMKLCGGLTFLGG